MGKLSNRVNISDEAIYLSTIFSNKSGIDLTTGLWNNCEFESNGVNSTKLSQSLLIFF